MDLVGMGYHEYQRWRSRIDRTEMIRQCAKAAWKRFFVPRSGEYAADVQHLLDLVDELRAENARLREGKGNG